MIQDTTDADVVEYEIIDPQSADYLLTAQGSAVAILETTSALEAAKLFAHLYSVSREVVVRFLDGRDVLLFTHQAEHMQRFCPVDETVFAEIEQIKSELICVSDIAAPTAELTIDIAQVWRDLGDYDDVVTKTKAFVWALCGHVEPALTIFVHGEIPLLPTLAAFYLLRSSAETVVFIDSLGQRVTVF